MTRAERYQYWWSEKRRSLQDREAGGEVSTLCFVKDSGRYGTSRDNDDKLRARGRTGKQRIQRGPGVRVLANLTCNSSAELEALHILSCVTVNPVNVIGKELASALPQFALSRGIFTS